MSASEAVMHQLFAKIVSEYHPFANYLGYREADDGFIICYQGVNEPQYMAIDIHGNVVGDTTMGTTRSMGLLAAGAMLLDLFTGGNSSNRY